MPSLAGIVTLMPSSNFNGSLVLDILRYARIPPQVLQVELHPYLTQDALVQLVKCHGIALTAYSSFGPQVRQPEHPQPPIAESPSRVMSS